jgi:cytochrome c oxidase subunit 3
MTQLTRSQYQSHQFHMVEASPWPLLQSLALLTLTVSAVLYFNGVQHSEVLLGLGFFSTLFGMILWFRDVTIEGTYLGDHTFSVQKGLTMGVGLFILTEALFFFSIFWAYFHSSLSPNVELGGHWPPAGIEAMNPFAIPLLNTVLLLSSGATVTYAHHALIEGNRRAALIGVGMTLLFAIVFTSMQAFEYNEAGFTMADGVYGSVFYFSTGFHGLHVIVGTLFIAVAFVRLINYHLTDHHHIGFESSILYWHFVDVVWLFLYISVYWWGS